tara:strand:- start:629 stop:8848 length:8220 start_codon:yes stop_codon:yes gene_type:complete
MPQKTNLNVSPYYDDYSASKNFYRLLFRPGYSIQARELTQLQSVLQNQIESIGRKQFKQGDLVIPGEVGLNNKLDYVKLSSVTEVAVSEGGNIVFKKYDIKQLVGQTLKGITSGVTGTVVSTRYSTTTTADTLYVNYTSSGNSNNESTFRQGETLEVIDGVNTPLMVVGTDGSVLPTSITLKDPDTDVETSITSPAMGFASAVQVEEGIYFVNGHFVRNDSDLIILEPYIDIPSAKVGFKITESLITPEEDSTLYDQARGFANFSAPGAHRLSITLGLAKYDYNASTDSNFIQLLTVKKGSVQKKVKQAEYNVIEETLARRTYDESGDYVVESFPTELREYYQKDGNKGLYGVGVDGTVNGLTLTEASQKMIAAVGVGKAYIKGYEIVNKESKYLTVNKSRESLERDNITLKHSGLASFYLTNTYNSVPLNSFDAELTAYPTLYLNSTFGDGSLGLNSTEDKTDGKVIASHKQTRNRRAFTSDADVAIKTVLINITSTAAGTTFSEIKPTSWESSHGSFWVRKGGSGNANEAVELTTLAYSKFSGSNADFPSSFKGSASYVEFTFIGPRDIVDTHLRDFTTVDSGTDNRTRLYFSENGAEQSTSTDVFGYIVSYSEMIVPTIGLAKPKDFHLQERGVGFNPDSDTILSKGRIAGTSKYNTTFKMSYFNPTFLTKITVDSDIPIPSPDNTPFKAGTYITGSKSGAYGVIEGSPNGLLSSGNRIYCKVLNGEFVQGETIFDEKGNSLRIARENTISHFVVDHRGNNYGALETLIVDGVSYDTSVITSTIDSADGYAAATIKNRDALSNVYSSPPAVVVKTTSTSFVAGNEAIVRAVLFKNVVQTYTPQNVKSMWCRFGVAPEGALAPNLFTSDVELFREKYVTSTTITDFSFSGVEGNQYIECTGFGGDASKSLVQGDLVQFSDANNNLIQAIVQQATSPQGTKKSRIYLDSLLPSTISSTTVLRVRPKIENGSRSTLIFPTGSKQIKSLVKNVDDTAIKYYQRKDFVLDSSSTGGKVTFKAQLEFGTQKFVEFRENNFILTVLKKGNATAVETGDIVYVPASAVDVATSTDTATGLTAGSVSITLPTNYFGEVTGAGVFPTLKLTATLEITKSRPRLKTIVKNKQIVIKPVGDRVLPLRGQDINATEINAVSYSDVVKLNYVYEGSSTAPPNVDTAGNLISGTDVTNRFTFDDGQRDTLYDVSRIVIKPGFDLPTGQLLASFDYFDHSQGDFCVVDSYVHEAGVSADDIPTFNSSVYGITNLRDVIDFRPKVDTESTITGFQDKSIYTESSFNQFNGSGGVVSSCPASDSNLPYTISFYQNQYLDRIDGIFLTKKGEFIVKEGNSSLNPSRPEGIDDAIPLTYLYIPAYTTTSNDVRVIPVDNKRYTMRDIGKLEKRVERLEYYTLLSVLEQQALNMQIKDEVGLERFKSGFVVDNFETHKVGNLKSNDYKCSIDTKQSVLRAQSKEDSFDLIEVNTKEDERVVAGYRRSSDVITLPYSNLSLLDNSFATKTINPNPFVVIQYVGDASLDTPVDSWYENTDAPLISDNNTSLYTIFLAKNNVRDAYSSLYNSYSVNWVGSNQNFFNIGPLSDINSDQVASTVKIANVASSSNISPQNNETGKGINTKLVGETAVATSLQQFARSKAVKFTVRRMKPNTKIYPFIEGRSVSRWTTPDLRFTGIPGNSLSTFGSDIITDDGGNASGLIIIPNGYAPTQGTTWNNYIYNTSYDTTSEQLQFTTGEKTIRFTSSSTDSNKDTVETYTEVKYYPTGILPSNPGSIVSTLPAYLKSNEGKQIVDLDTSTQKKPSPLAQTFKIEGYEGGVFVTSLYLFFNKKASKVPVRTYITNTVSGKPGSYIVPGTEKTISPETKLKFYVSQETSLEVGEIVTGQISGATGPIFKIFDRTGIEVLPGAADKIPVSADQVYTLVLSNNNGNSFQSGEQLIAPSITLANNTNNTSISVTIAKDSGSVVDLKVISAGSNYDSAAMTIESPQLPGGTTATGTLGISGGKLFNSEVSISGSGYTSAPSIVIAGTGSGNAGAAVEGVVKIDTPAVRMGVSTNLVTDVAGSVPTEFEFDYPVYLQNDTEYAFVIETDSTDYEVWASEVGEPAGSGTVTVQPGLGSVYRSQNVDSWTENLKEDIKFQLNRAEFDISRTASVMLTNDNIGYETMDDNSIRTSAEASSSATLERFRGNNKYIEVTHRDHGFEDSGKSFAFFKGLKETGGISASSMNTTLFTVENSGIDSFNIVSTTNASSNAIGGGSGGLISLNKKFEKLYADIGYLSFPQTKIESSVKTTNIVPVDSGPVNYVSYSQSDYEKTFIKQEHFFINQKVLASRINALRNDIANSLVYKLDLSSTQSTLSPIIDLRTSSVKTISNRIENPTGSESRYGRQNQIIKLYPIVTFAITGHSGAAITVPQSINSTTVAATSEVADIAGGAGTIIGWDSGTSTMTVQITNEGSFKARETLTFGADASLNTVTTITDAGSSLKTPTFTVGTTVNRYNEQQTTTSDTTDDLYLDKISGTVVEWDAKTQELVLFNNKQPINDDFTSKVTALSPYERKKDPTDQQNDIFRVTDLLSFVGQEANTETWWEVKTATLQNGVGHVSEDSSKNTSGIAKYVTKEIAIENPGTSIDVKITTNLRNIDDIKVLYKIKEESSEVNFDDIEWKFFNEDGKADIELAPTPENEISGLFEKQDSYQEIPFSISNLPEFTSFAVKVVMNSDNPAYVPKLQDIRAVASF